MKSLARERRNGNGPVHLKGRVLKPGVEEKGYLAVNLCSPNKYTRKKIHHLVLEAFDKPRPRGMRECRHLDGDPTNNCVGNLQWGTREENYQDRVRHGRDEQGEKSPNARLTDERVRAAKDLRATGKWTFKRIGILFDVSAATIHLAVTNKQWKHIK